jgi:hypothetical protein
MPPPLALRRPWLGVLALPLLLAAGCASTDAAAEVSVGEAPPAPRAAAEDATTADPYGERPGSDERPSPRPGPVGFDRPGPLERPAPPNERPPWTPAAKLAVVTVRRGALDFDGALVLELEAALGGAQEFGGVYALLEPTGAARVDAAALARQAGREGRDLLLVDVRSSGPNQPREAFVLHPEGLLLARYTLDARREDPDPSPSPGGRDPLRLLELAYRRVAR